MSLRKLYSFVLVATVAGFATVGILNVQIKEYEVPTPHSRPHDPALGPTARSGTRARGRISWAGLIR